MSSFLSRTRLVVLSVFVMLAPVVHALSVEAEGVAVVTNNAPGKARVIAIQNAIRQAAMQNSVQISATTVMNNHTIVGDTARLRSAARIANVTVADEWQEDGEYHVLVRAEIIPGESGEPDMKNSARKKVAFLQLNLRDRGAAADLPLVEIELPRLLRKEAEARANILGVDATNYSLADPEQPSAAPAAPPAALIVQVARDLGAQFLVTGEIVDTGISPDLVGQSRRFGVEFHVYDGVSGSLLARLKFDEKVIGGGRAAQGVGVGSAEFFQSPYGKAVAQVVKRAAGNLAAELNRLPLTAHVVRVSDKKVYLDAGATAQIRVGDMLMAYKVDKTPVTDPANGQFLGYPEEPIATLVIRSVQPQFAIGELETDKVTLKPGDVVRFAW